MPKSIVNEIKREIEPLQADDLIAPAAERLVEEGLPGLPAVERDGSFAGIFGQREFMAALFPAYLRELASAAMVRRSVDETIERRGQCAAEPIRPYLTTDHILVEDDYSDTQLVEIFLHHRVLIVPIATAGRVHAVVTREAFFELLVKRLTEAADEGQAGAS